MATGHLTLSLGKRGSEQAARRFLGLSWDQDRMRGNTVSQEQRKWPGAMPFTMVPPAFSGPESPGA